MSEIKNPVKFVKVMNTKSGIAQVIPLSTWERLSGESVKAIKHMEFLYSCEENGTKIDDPTNRIENKKPLFEDPIKKEMDALRAELIIKDNDLNDAKKEIETLKAEIEKAKKGKKKAKEV